MKFLKILGFGVLTVALMGCKKKSEAAEKEIREAGYEMTAEGWFGAIRANDVSVLKKMVDGGFNEKTKDADGNNGLHIAAAEGNREVAEFLLNRGFSIDEPGAMGRTALMSAVVIDKPMMVKWLLRQGADPNLKDSAGFMSLMLAVTEGRKSAVEELAPYHREELDSALLLASLQGKTEVIDALTNYGASVYARMEDGRTALMLAAENGHTEAAALLVEIGASRFAKTEGGDTAQSFAVAAGHVELAEMIESGFTGDELALESEAEVADAMEDYLEAAGEASGDGLIAVTDGENEEAGVPAGSEDSGEIPEDRKAAVPGDAGQGNTAVVSKKRVSEKSVLPLEGAQVSGKRSADPAVSAEIPGDGRTVIRQAVPEELPLVMRYYRQRELPVEVKKVSGGVAFLRLAGAGPNEMQVSAGGAIPESNLLVVRVFTRTEQGKLNEGAPIEVGIVEVEDKSSGQRREWVAGQPTSGHDPVALVEDAATGQRYLAKPGQKFRSEDGREFVVNDVRPSQLVIEDVASGEVSTLRLRGPKG